MKVKDKLSAQALRVILLIILIVLLIGAGIGFYIVQKQLHSFAQTTNSLNQQADEGDTTLKQLQQLQAYLAAHQDDIDLAHNVVGNQQDYLSDRLDELRTIANKDNVTIDTFSFSSTGSGATGAATSEPAASGAAATTTPSASAAAKPGAGAISGVKMESINITLKGPIPYTSLLNFVNDVESSPSRMQISSLSLSGGSGGVSIGPLTIEVYVR